MGRRNEDKVDRKTFKRHGVRFIDMNHRYTWKESWHEHEEYAFCSGKAKTCDDCNKEIAIGELYSIGVRQIEIDAPVDIDGIDVVHWYCYGGSEEESSYQKYFQDCVTNVASLAGFDCLSAETKKTYLDWAGETYSEDTLNKKPALEGLDCIICGEFEQSKDEIQRWIEGNGGKVSQTVTRSLKYILLGRNGVTEYGQKTGTASKKYKDAKKKKCKVVTMQQLKDAVKNGTTPYDDSVKPKKRARESLDEDSGSETEEPEKKKAKVNIPVDELDDMKRAGLQALAKKCNIPANLKNDDLREKLKSYAEEEE
ncbi:ligA2 [Acrasis kona]|uniref:LigA2 n=1 Tax=Acrasis kona TaxID=1008807 RepID=A0AAW2ZR86_9EUKA